MNEVDSGKKRNGNTTRLADAYIQSLFQTGSILVSDHYHSTKSNIRLADIIRRRLSSEHPHAFAYLSFKERGRYIEFIPEYYK